MFAKRPPWVWAAIAGIVIGFIVGIWTPGRVIITTPAPEPEALAVGQELKVRVGGDGEVECLPHLPHRRAR